MQLPKTLRIDGELWSVVIISRNDLERTNKNNYVATANYKTYEISIDGSMPVDRQLSGLHHELTHIISHNRGLDLEESAIQSLSNGLFGVIVDHNLDFRQKQEAKNATSSS